MRLLLLLEDEQKSSVILVCYLLRVTQSMHVLTFSMIMLLSPLHALAQAENKGSQLPLWELGVGAGGFSVPQYMGSDERYTLPFAFPFLRNVHEIT